MVAILYKIYHVDTVSNITILTIFQIILASKFKSSQAAIHIAGNIAIHIAIHGQVDLVERSADIYIYTTTLIAIQTEYICILLSVLLAIFEWNIASIAIFLSILLSS